MWIFSLITVILVTTVKISAPCHAVRDHYRCERTSPLPPLLRIQLSLEIKCLKRFNKGKEKPDIACLISSHSRIKPRCIHQGDEMWSVERLRIWMQSSVTYNKFHYCKIQFILPNGNELRWFMLSEANSPLLVLPVVWRDIYKGTTSGPSLSPPSIAPPLGWKFHCWWVWKKTWACVAQLLLPSPWEPGTTGNMRSSLFLLCGEGLWFSSSLWLSRSVHLSLWLSIRRFR